MITTAQANSLTKIIDRWSEEASADSNITFSSVIVAMNLYLTVRINGKMFCRYCIWVHGLHLPAIVVSI